MRITGKYGDGEVSAVVFALVFYSLWIAGMLVSAILFTLSLGYSAIVDYNGKKKKEKHERANQQHLSGMLHASERHAEASFR